MFGKTSKLLNRSLISDTKLFNKYQHKHQKSPSPVPVERIELLLDSLIDQVVVVRN